MEFKINQLNFLYLYKYCQECHIDAKAYDNYNIEDICEEDSIALMKFIMVREGIFVSYDEYLYADKIENYLKQSDANNLSKLGISLSNKVKLLAKYKEEISLLERNITDRFFIENFKKAVFKTKDIKLAIEILYKHEEKKTTVPDNKEKSRKRIMNLVFSKRR